MTREQAIAAAAAQNAVLKDSDIVSVANRKYNNLFNEVWFTQFIPTKYQTQFNNSTNLDIELSFARVNLIVSSSSADDYVSSFDTAAAADPILSPYLFPDA